MPLIKGKSDRAFSQNVRTEMHHGKPQDQSLAIAYNMKRKAQKMASGGDCYAHGTPDCPTCHAEGGFIGSHQSPSTSKDQEHHEIPFHEDETRDYMPPHEPGAERNEMATEEDDRDLDQHGEDEQGPYGTMMAEGGQIEDNEQTSEHMLDMVGRIMKQRQMHYSKGGQVANAVPRIGGSGDNNFDDLYLRDDDMEDADYTGENSGDEVGNEGEDERRHDIVSRIMKSRNKKGNRMPGTERSGL